MYFFSFGKQQNDSPVYGLYSNDTHLCGHRVQVIKIDVWLKSIQLSCYSAVFLENDIDFSVLPYLDDTHLEKLGVSIGHRIKIINAAKTLVIEPDESLSDPERQQAERRHLTVMFSDLVGSTELSQQLDPEDLRELNLAFQQVTTRSIENFGGYVARYMGDGVLAYFGYPQAHEDDAERSILAGLDLLQKITEIPSPVELSVRLGIATGLVVVGDLIGEGAAQESAVVGETPNLAARLQSAAEVNSILVSDETYALAKESIDFAQLPGISLKGFSELKYPWRVLNEKLTESRFQAKGSHRSSPFIGRMRELLKVRELWRLARDGNGQSVLIKGEAGIGKSRLVEELVDTTRDSQVKTLRYQCSPHRTNSPFFPFCAQIVRAASIQPNDGLSSKQSKLSGLITTKGELRQEVVDTFYHLLTFDSEAPASDNVSTRQTKAKTINALCMELRSLCETSPVLIVFEDAHWIDPSSQEVLDKLVRLSSQLTVLIAITSRPHYTTHWQSSCFQQMILDRLSEMDSAEIVKNIATRHMLTDGIIAKINSQSDGVPLFIEEITKSVLEAATREVKHSVATTNTRELTVPASLQDSLMARLDNLGSAKQLAQIAAAIGREFTDDLIAALYDGTEDELERSLKNLMSSGLVYSHTGRGKTTFQFNHALIRDTAYDSMLISTRKSVHKKIAQILQGNLHEESELIAYHYGCADEPEEALKYWRYAGEKASLRSANIESIAHFKKALACVKKIPKKNQVSEELKIQLALGAAYIAPMGYASDEVLQAFQRAADLSQNIGHSVSRFSSMRGVWSNQLLRAEVASASLMADNLLILAGETDNPLQKLMAHRIMGTTHLGCGQYVEAKQQFELALSIYDPEDQEDYIRQWGEDPGLFCMVYRAWMNDWLGDRDTAVTQLDESIALARSLPNRYGLSHVLAMACLVYQLRSDPNMVLELTDAAIGLSKEQGVQWLAWSRVHRGWALSKVGEAEKGLQICAQGIDEIKKTGTRFPLPHLLPLLAEILIDNGELKPAAKVLGEAMGIVSKANCGHLLSELYKINGELAIKQGASNRANEQFGEARALAKSQQANTLELRAVIAQLRYQQQLGDGNNTRDALSILYNKFTQGHSTPDLIEAKSLLSV